MLTKKNIENKRLPNDRCSVSGETTSQNGITLYVLGEPLGFRKQIKRSAENTLYIKFKTMVLYIEVVRK